MSACKKCGKPTDTTISCPEYDQALIGVKQTTSQVGWVCPKCGSVYSPSTQSCWKCMDKNITCCDSGKIKFTDGTEMLD